MASPHPQRHRPAPPPRRRHLDADLVTRNDVVALLACCGSDPIGVRNRTLIVLLWRTGLRISEALALVEKDLTLEQGVLVVQRGKGGHRRVIGLDDETVTVMREWLSVRASAFAPAPQSLLFCTRGGGQIDASYVRRLLPRLARRAGISKRIHSHALRHLFALELQAEGAPMTTIRDLLGHASLGTTDVYLRRLGAKPAIDFAQTRMGAIGIRPSEAGAAPGHDRGRKALGRCSPATTRLIIRSRTAASRSACRGSIAICQSHAMEGYEPATRASGLADAYEQVPDAQVHAHARA